MKKILFVETLLDHRTSLEYLRRHSAERKDMLVINLNASHAMDYAGWGVDYKKETDYLREDVVAGINEKSLELGRTWFLDPSLSPLLELDGLNVGLILENFLVRQWIALTKYLRLAKEIRHRERCQHWILIDCPDPATNAQTLLPSNEEKMFNDVVAMFKRHCPVEVQTIPSLRGTGSRSFSMRGAVKNAIEPAAQWVRRLGNRVLAMRDDFSDVSREEKAIALVGAPRLIFPLIEELHHEGVARLVYFQKSFAPRMAQRLLRTKTLYKVSEDYQSPQDAAVQEGLRQELANRLGKLVEHKNFHARMTLDGHDMTGPMGERLHYVFVECLSDILIGVKRFQRFFKDQNIGVVVIDEAVKEFSRPFVLAASARGIPSVEIQHGVPDYYVHHRLVTTRLAAWGQYGKDRFVAESGLPSHDVIVTGSPTLDRLKLRDSQRDLAFVRRRLRVRRSDRIITFAASPFHLGSRGGVIGEHLTREQVEFAFREVLKAANAQDHVHLIVKLHHTDPNLRYAQAFVRQSGFRKPFSVVKSMDIYPLMHAAQAFVSMGSTAILEAMVMETPIVLIDFSGRPDPYPYAAWGALRRVTKPGELKSALRQILHDPKKYRGQTAQGRERVLRELACEADGQAGRRCVALIRNLLSAREVSGEIVHGR